MCLSLYGLNMFLFLSQVALLNPIENPELELAIVMLIVPFFVNVGINAWFLNIHVYYFIHLFSLFIVCLFTETQGRSHIVSQYSQQGGTSRIWTAKETKMELKQSIT